MKKTDFRIIKVKYENGKERFHLQMKSRLFWIGPKVWQTYSSFAHHYYDTYGFRFFKWTAEDFLSESCAKDAMDKYIIDNGWDIKKSHVVKEFTYEP